MSITNENPAHDEEPEPQPTPAARGGASNMQGSLAQRRPAGYDQGPVQNTSGITSTSVLDEQSCLSVCAGLHITSSGQLNAK